MSETFKKAESLVSELKEYVNTRVAQVKLSIVEKLSKVVTYIIMAFVIALGEYVASVIVFVPDNRPISITIASELREPLTA